MNKLFSLFAGTIIAMSFLCGCSVDGYHDPINGHYNIIKDKIDQGSRVLFIGDSVTDENDPRKLGLGSWVDRFEEYANITADNIAVGGSTYALYRENVSGFSYKYGTVENINLEDYDFIFIAGGVNNINGVDDVYTSFQDLEYTCNSLAKYGNKVILCNPFYYIGSVNDMTKKEATLFREKVYENAVKYGFSYIDLTKIEYERADRIHPSPLGCIQIAYQIYELLADK